MRPNLWPYTAITIIALAFLTYACDEDTTNAQEPVNGEGVVLPNGSVFTRGALLEAFALCITDSIESFELQSRAFKKATENAASDPDLQIGRAHV